MALPKLINLEQGSDEWKEFRRSKIGASDADTIMGCGVNSLLSLYDTKIHGKDFSPTEAMKHGTETEEEARIWACMELRKIFVPMVFVHPTHEFMSASFDGVSLNWKEALEIKCPGIKLHLQALKGEIPKKYQWQMLHQMEVLNLDKIYYVSYFEGNGVIIEFKRDQKRIDDLIEKEKAFYFNHILQKIPPSDSPLTEEDLDEDSVILLSECFAEIASLRASVKKQKEREDELKEMIKSITENRSVKICNFSATKSISRGSIEYKSIPELSGVNLDQYRGDNVERWTINL